MKRFLVILFVLLLVLAVAVPALADHNAGPCNTVDEAGNSNFALHHILIATAAGQGAHVPGGHQGYSTCLGVH